MRGGEPGALGGLVWMDGEERGEEIQHGEEMDGDLVGIEDFWDNTYRVLC